MFMSRSLCWFTVLQVMAICYAQEQPDDDSYEYEDETSTRATTPAPTNPRSQCVDQMSFGFMSCKDSRHLCDNPFFSFAMKSQCARTCGVCNDVAVPQRDQECIDSKDMFGFDSCAFRKPLCSSPDSFWNERTRKDCPKTCGLC